MFKEIHTMTLSDFVSEFPDISVPDQVASDPSYYVRIGVPENHGPVAIEFSPDPYEWEKIK